VETWALSGPALASSERLALRVSRVVDLVVDGARETHRQCARWAGTVGVRALPSAFFVSPRVVAAFFA
jgi:hypothetical protein